MAPRYVAEKDFGLKVALRKVLWAQGHTTRINVVLGYDVDPRGRARAGRASLTDLDVLGLRLDPGFRVQTVVGECKSGTDKVAENLFWLSGVARFFGSDAAMLVRLGRVPEHAPILARALGVALVSQDDLTILTNTYAPTAGSSASDPWDAFFSAETVSGVLALLGRLPDALRPVTIYRETQYWMQAPHLRLTRTVAALRSFSYRRARDFIAQVVFADYVWLYVLALWDACERLTATGLAQLDHGLQVYLNGDESGLQNMRRLEGFIKKVVGDDVAFPILPPYYKELLDLITRVVRRPQALARMARRAEWLLFGQLGEPIGPPPWPYAEDDVLCDKLLGDVAIFLGRSSEVHPSLIEAYLKTLQEPHDGAAPSHESESAVNVLSGAATASQPHGSQDGQNAGCVSDGASADIQNDAQNQRDAPPSDRPASKLDD